MHFNLIKVMFGFLIHVAFKMRWLLEKRTYQKLVLILICVYNGATFILRPNLLLEEIYLYNIYICIYIHTYVYKI